MNTVSFHDRPDLWQKLLGPAKRQRQEISFCVYSYNPAGHWRKHENLTTANEALEYARHLVEGEGVARVEIKKTVRDPKDGSTVELDYKILS